MKRVFEACKQTMTADDEKVAGVEIPVRTRFYPFGAVFTRSSLRILKNLDSVRKFVHQRFSRYILYTHICLYSCIYDISYVYVSTMTMIHGPFFSLSA